MKRTALSLILAYILSGVTAQVAPGMYFIEFRNKNGNPYSLDRPEEFLSARALQRRQNQWIGYDSADLPITPSYISGIQALGVTVLATTKWLNGVIVNLPDTSLLDTILNLPYVKGTILYSGPFLMRGGERDKFTSEAASFEEVDEMPMPVLSSLASGYNYGASFTQIHMVNGDLLHQQGFRGEGRVIAVLDAGFQNADILSVFDSLRMNNQILGTRDFVKPGNNVYKEHPHGTEVLSIIGGNIPGKLVGTAPRASFWLFRTEETGSEYIIEEFNWVAAAEVADSAGADVITSSLGYTVFNDPRQDHTCADMNGYTTPVSRGANVAATKGIIVTSSAGNSGGTSWRCISSPADALGAMGIGAVDSLGHYAGFSSLGEVSTRVKPNVVAQGEKTVLAAPDGAILRGSGTSFSAPIIAGMMACLSQAVPTATNYNLIRATELSASQASNPDSLIGYGIPDFSRAISLVGVNARIPSGSSVSIVPNPFTDHFSLRIIAEKEGSYTLTLFDQVGRIIIPAMKIQVRAGENRIPISDPSFENLDPGFYLLRIHGNEISSGHAVVKKAK